MPQERKLLSQKNGKAGISPKYGSGAKILKEITGFFLPDLAAAITNGSINGWVQSGFIRTFKEGVQVEQGDIGDLVGKFVGMTEITLTNQNFFLVYKKGFRSKQQKMIVLPLKYATDVETEGIVLKEVHVKFEVPHREKKKPLRFDLGLGVTRPETWLGTVEQAIRAILPIPIEEKILGGIEVGKPRSHGLYFTQKRAIVARTYLSFIWILLTFLLMVLGTFVTMAGLIGMIEGYGGSPQIFFLIGVALLSGLLLVAFSAEKRRFKKLSKLPPEGVLMDDKKNFEILYSDITRLHIKKGRIVFADKLEILTDSKKHKFSVKRKKQFGRHLRLIRFVLPEKVYVS